MRNFLKNKDKNLLELKNTSFIKDFKHTSIEVKDINDFRHLGYGDIVIGDENKINDIVNKNNEGISEYSVYSGYSFHKKGDIYILEDDDIGNGGSYYEFLKIDDNKFKVIKNEEYNLRFSYFNSHLKETNFKDLFELYIPYEKDHFQLKYIGDGIGDKILIIKYNDIKLNEPFNEIIEKMNNCNSFSFDDFIKGLESEGNILYHGTSADSEFSKFKGKEVYFTNNSKTAIGFSEDKSFEKMKKYNITERSESYNKFWDEDGRLKHNIYKIYKPNFKKPLIIDAESNDWDGIKTPKEMGGKGTKTTDQITRWARNNGYDGIIYKNIVDGSGYMPETHYVVFNPETIILEKKLKELFDKTKSGDYNNYRKSYNIIKEVLKTDIDKLNHEEVFKKIKSKIDFISN